MYKYHRKQEKKVLKKKVIKEKLNRNRETKSILKKKEISIKPERLVPYYVVKKWRRVFTKASAFQKLSKYYEKAYNRLKASRVKVRELMENKLEEAVFRLS